MTKKIIPNQPATKLDITALNVELKKTERVLRNEILRVEERVENVEDGMKRLEGKVDGIEKRLGDKIDGIEVKLDRIANQLDGFVGRVDDLTNDNEIGTDQIHLLRETSKDHEKRIAKLESVN